MRLPQRGPGGDRGRLVAPGFAVFAVLTSACVLWLRQTEDALLRVDSFGGALAQVLFWAAPGLVLYLTLTRPGLGPVIQGGLISVLMVVQWWSSATDWHSTASIGPGAVGWLLIPAVVLLGRVMPPLYRQPQRPR